MDPLLLPNRYYFLAALSEEGMKGIVFLLLKKAIREELGEEVVDDVLAEAGLKPSFGEVEDYDDPGLKDLMVAAEPYVEGSSSEVERWFGRRALETIAVEYPSFFENHESIETFVQSLDDEIHPEVQKLYPGAVFPEFDVSDSQNGDSLWLVYRSDRELCNFAEGLLKGTADRYGQKVELEQSQCTHRGDPHCRIIMSIGE